MSSSTGIEKELFWEQLLQRIEKRQVVPVIGQELLRLPLASGEAQLYPYLAERLAGMLEVSGEGLPSVSALHEVVCRYLDRGGDIENVYPALQLVLSGSGELPIPEPLRKLAAIKPFQLFVTTTFDPLLERAINQVCFAGKTGEKTDVCAYSPGNANDLPLPFEKLERPVVYHLFGKISATPDYAVTEEDMLEFVHSFHSGQPPNLFDALTKQDLLLLGVSFPNWIARFFVRLAKAERLREARRKTDWVVDPEVSSDRGLVLFLKRFSVRTKVFLDGDVAEFIAELDQRWQKRHPVGPGDNGSSGETRMKEGAVFLSYAHEDLKTAQSIKEQLESRGIDVWIDRVDLKPGDPYEWSIKLAIEHCSAFVPLLSRHVLTSQRRFFRLEWDYADQVAVRVLPTEPFIVPIALDDISSEDKNLPERFRGAHWELVSGQCTDSLVEVLSKACQNYRRAYGDLP